MRSIFIYAHFLVLSLTLIAVKADDAHDQKVASDLFNMVCKDEEHPPEWYSCIQCCQSMQPFYSQYDPNSLARDLLDQGQSGASGAIGLDLNAETKGLMCTKSKEYSIVLKNLITDLKGPLKPGYDTVPGLEAFYQQKTDCFYGCEADPAAKKDCIPFKSSLDAPQGNAALKYYMLYKGQGSNSAVVAATNPKCDTLPSTDPDYCPPNTSGYIIFDQIAKAIEAPIMANAKAAQDRAVAAP